MKIRTSAKQQQDLINAAQAMKAYVMVEDSYSFHKISDDSCNSSFLSNMAQICKQKMIPGANVEVRWAVTDKDETTGKDINNYYAEIVSIIDTSLNTMLKEVKNNKENVFVKSLQYTFDRFKTYLASIKDQPLITWKDIRNLYAARVNENSDACLVDVLIAINVWMHRHEKEQPIFICAGGAHCNEIFLLLEELGYTEVVYDKNTGINFKKFNGYLKEYDLTIRENIYKKNLQQAPDIATYFAAIQKSKEEKQDGIRLHRPPQEYLNMINKYINTHVNSELV